MILFVEDDSLSRRAFVNLPAEGYQVAEAGNGAEALEILLREPKYSPMKPLIW